MTWKRMSYSEPSDRIRFGLGFSFDREHISLLVLFWILNWERA